MDALHGEAWRCCQDLILDLPAIQRTDGCKEVFRRVQAIEKVTVVKKTEQFDRFFDRGFRKKGQALDAYLRSRRQDWADLKELDENTNMSDDLLAYFILKHCNLSRDERRQILLANRSAYDLDGIEQAMKVSFFDIHEREKSKKSAWESRPKGYGKGSRRGFAHFVEGGAEEQDEVSYDQDLEAEYVEEIPDEVEGGYMAEELYDMDEPGGDEGGKKNPSDAGASGDDDVYEAYAAMDKQRHSYKESRKRLKDIQKQRGFFKGGANDDDRRKAIEKEKARTRCSACNRVGRWAGDPECSKTTHSGPKRSKGKGKGKGGRFRGKGGKAYLVSEEPLYFTLGLEDDEDELCSAYMVKEVEDKDDEKKEMEQDAGLTELDFKRKAPKSSTSDDWSLLSSQGYSSSDLPTPWSEEGLKAFAHDLAFPPKAAPTAALQQMPVTVTDALAHTIKVPNRMWLLDKVPDMTLREMQEDRISGNKAELCSRLQDLFSGKPVLKKGCSKQFIVMEDQFVRGSATEQPLADVPRGSQDIPTPKATTGFSRSPVQTPERNSEDGRSFRSRASPIIRSLEQQGAIFRTPPLATRIGTPGTTGSSPTPVKLGEALPGVPCAVCGSSMVARQNRTKFNFFFGCSWVQVHV